MLAHASDSEQLVPGELFSIGALSAGSGMEINRWLDHGDTLELGLPGVGHIPTRSSKAQGTEGIILSAAGPPRLLSLPLGPYLDDGHGGGFGAEIAPGVPRAVLHDCISRPQPGQLSVVEFQPQVTV